MPGLPRIAEGSCRAATDHRGTAAGGEAAGGAVFEGSAEAKAQAAGAQGGGRVRHAVQPSRARPNRRNPRGVTAPCLPAVRRPTGGGNTHRRAVSDRGRVPGGAAEVCGACRPVRVVRPARAGSPSTANVRRAGCGPRATGGPDARPDRLAQQTAGIVARQGSRVLSAGVRTAAGSGDQLSFDAPHGRAGRAGRGPNSPRDSRLTLRSAR